MAGSHSAHAHDLEICEWGDWGCDICGGDTTPRWRCASGCDWDCCQICLDKDKPVLLKSHPEHAHDLEICEWGDWGCDICGGDTTPRWRCASGCDWDCCQTCLDEVEPTTSAAPADIKLAVQRDRPPSPFASWFREEAAKPEDLSDLEGEADMRRELVRLRRLFRAAAKELPTRIDAALGAEKWDQAVNLAAERMSEDSEGAKLIVERVATHLIQAREAAKAMEMFARTHLWDQAYDVAKTHLSESNLDSLMMKHAEHVASTGDYKQAEELYLKAGQWQGAINMWRENDQWDEAMRVAKTWDENGGTDETMRIAYHLAKREDGRKLLVRSDLVEQTIDYAAVKRRDFDLAFELARTCMAEKAWEVHLKKALWLEDTENFKAAEDEFVKAGKPKEAIDMYIHLESWDDAMRVAEHYTSDSIPQVFRAQAEWALSKKDYKTAESLYINGKKPEKALQMYKEAQMWNDAVRICKLHMPDKLHSTNLAWQRYADTVQDSSDIIASARTSDDSPVDDEEEAAAEIATNKLAEVASASMGFSSDDEEEDELEALVSLLQSGDTKKIIAFAGSCRKKECFVLAANYLQQVENLHEKEDIVEIIIMCYTKARAFKQLSRFYDTVAEFEMNENRNYDRAAAAMQKAVKFMHDRGKDKDGKMEFHEMPKKKDEIASLEQYQEKLRHISEFAEAQKMVGENPSKMISICEGLLKKPKIELYLRAGDILALLVEYYDYKEMFQDAMRCIQQMQLTWKLDLSVYLDDVMLERIFEANRQRYGGGGGGRDSADGDSDDIEDEILDDGEDLVREGKVVEGLDVMVQRNQWEKVFKTVAHLVAGKGNAAVSGKYAAKYAQKLMQQEDGPDVRQAVNYLAKFGVASNQPAYFMLYTDIASQCFSLTEKEEAEFGKEVMLDCREMLYKLTAELGRNPEYVKADKLKEFQNLLKIAHFICLGYLCEQNGQKELEALFSIALLKDCGPVAWDKAYLKAGQSCESLRWNNLAYMFYSRYLDIIEAIEEEDSSTLEDPYSTYKDLPSPYNMEIPKPDRVFSDKETEQEIRDKTLEWAMDDTLDEDSGIDDLKTKLKFAQAATAEVGKRSKRWIAHYRPGSRRKWDDVASLNQMIHIMRLS